MQEKDAAEKERKAAEDAYNAAVIARDRRALELDRMEKDCRKKIHDAHLRFNKALVIFFIELSCLFEALIKILFSRPMKKIAKKKISKAKLDKMIWRRYTTH